jgi:hypothetical protein
MVTSNLSVYNMTLVNRNVAQDSILVLGDSM